MVAGPETERGPVEEEGGQREAAVGLSKRAGLDDRIG